MLPDFEVAAYAVEVAIDQAYSADMKGPCQCEDFKKSMQVAIMALEEAHKAVHLWKGKEVKE